MRPSLWANLGSPASSGAPISWHSRANWVSLPAVTMSSPSPVGRGSYGNRLGCALPIRYGTTPPVTQALVWFTIPDSAEDSRLASTCCPAPVAARS